MRILSSFSSPVDRSLDPSSLTKAWQENQRSAIHGVLHTKSNGFWCERTLEPFRAAAKRTVMSVPPHLRFGQGRLTALLLQLYGCSDCLQKPRQYGSAGWQSGRMIDIQSNVKRAATANGLGVFVGAPGNPIKTKTLLGFLANEVKPARGAMLDHKGPE